MARLTRKIIQEICPLVKLRLTKKEICHIVGISVETLRRWTKKGYAEKKGIAYELVLAIERAEAEMYQDYASVVENAALLGSTTVTIKETETGNEKTTKIEGPNAALALKWLERSRPELWAPKKFVEIDWKQSMRDQGFDNHEITEHDRKIDAVIVGVMNDDDEH